MEEKNGMCEVKGSKKRKEAVQEIDLTTAISVGKEQWRHLP
jgi:hypothetical protein